MDSEAVLVDKNSRALHGRTRSLLESAVLFGEFLPGQLLPPERKLAELYNVTRTTIRRSLSKLVDDGLLEYQPCVGHRVVPTLRNSHSVVGRTIGLVWNVIPTFGKVDDLQVMMSESKHILMLGASGAGGQNEDETIRRMAANGMAGLIITPARTGGQRDELESWVRHGHPVVLQGHPGRWAISKEIESSCNMIDADNTDGMRQLYEYVSGKGHCSAAFLSLEPFAYSERFIAFESLAPKFGIKTKKSWNIENIEPTVEASSIALAKLKKRGELPSVFVCSHHLTALAMLDAIKEAGMQCPGDISVVAFTHPEFLSTTEHDDLTNVSWSAEEEAQGMLKLLSKQFSSTKNDPEYMRIPMTLKKGNTVKTVNNEY